MISLLKKLFIVIALGVTIALGYYLFVHKSASDVSDGSVGLRVEIETRDFLISLNELKSINLDSGIFSDPRFYSLENFNSPIETEPIGRDNPFELN